MTTLQVYKDKYATDFVILDARYEGIKEYVKDLCNGDIRSLVISGAPGVGKSYSVGSYLKQYATGNVKIVNGKTTIAQLYLMLYAYRNKGDVLVLDDSDSVYESIEGLSLLKAAMDTSEQRNVSWETKRAITGVPNNFEFNGSIILVTNCGFSNSNANKKQAAHLKALVGRTFTLQVANDGIENCFKQICYMAIERNMLNKYNFDDVVTHKLLSFIDMHKENLNDVSLRTLEKIADLYVITKGQGWDKRALLALSKGE